MTNNDTKPKIIRVTINSMAEIPLAYQKAVDEYAEGVDVWNAKIELKRINFEDNFRRTTRECVFEITEGDYLYE